MNYKLSLSPLFVLEIIASILFIVFLVLVIFIFHTFEYDFWCGFIGNFWKNMLEFQMGGLKDMLTQFSFVIAGFLLVFPGIITSVLEFCIFLWYCFEINN